MTRDDLITIPQDMHESPVQDVERDAWLNLPLGELVVAVSHYRLKGFHNHAEEAEILMWSRAAEEGKGL